MSLRSALATLGRLAAKSWRALTWPPLHIALNLWRAIVALANESWTRFNLSMLFLALWTIILIVNVFEKRQRAIRDRQLAVMRSALAATSLTATSPWPWLYDPPTELEEHWTPTPITAFKVIPDDRPPDIYWTPAHCAAERYHSDLVGIQTPHDAPLAECTCGFYSWKTYEGALSLQSSDMTYATIWQVELSGTVIEHEYGYRSERLKLVRRLR